MLLELAGAFSLGLVAGHLLNYLLTTRPLVNDIRRLRYDGFRPDMPTPPRPKTVPLPTIRED